MAGKRIALLLAQGDEAYQKEFTEGLMKQALFAGYDVCVYSMCLKYQNKKEREIGESNIYNLIDYSRFDGVIILSDSIQTPGVERKIEEKVKALFSGPVVCIDTDSPYFYHFWTDGYEAVYETISHLIEVHGFQDIAFLTGRSNHVHSKRRLKAYRDCMKAHDLPIREDRIIIGDFWYDSGTVCAENLLRNRRDLPQAVACANDCMAIGLAEELERSGVSVPGDVAVTGYGTSEEGQTCPKVLTSSYIPAAYYGEYAFDSLIRILKGDEPGQPNPNVKLFIGESCGCSCEACAAVSGKRDTWMTGNSEGGFYSIANFFSEDMLLATSLEDFFRTVYESIFYLRGVKKLEIRLDTNWLDPEKLLKNDFMTEGYPEKMIKVLSYDAEDADLCRVGTDVFCIPGDLGFVERIQWPEVI